MRSRTARATSSGVEDIRPAIERRVSPPTARAPGPRMVSCAPGAKKPAEVWFARAIRATAASSDTIFAGPAAIDSKVSPGATTCVPPPGRASAAPARRMPACAPSAAARSAGRCPERSTRSRRVSPGCVVSVSPVAQRHRPARGEQAGHVQVQRHQLGVADPEPVRDVVEGLARSGRVGVGPVQVEGVLHELAQQEREVVGEQDRGDRLWRDRLRCDGPSGPRWAGRQIAEVRATKDW